jgi:fructokinase
MRAVLVTHGARGCSLATADHALNAPIRDLPGDILDPMGAGDATVAAIAYRLLRHGWPATARAWRDTLSTAMTAAALTCRRHGAATATPRRNELDNSHLATPRTARQRTRSIDHTPAGVRHDR